MKYFLVGACLILLSGCTAHDKTTPDKTTPPDKGNTDEGYFKEIGWRLKFPENIVFQNTYEIDSLQNETIRKLYKSSQHVKASFKTLFSIVDSLNGFNATIENYDTDNKNWEDVHSEDRAFLLETLESHKKNIVIEDTLSSDEVIDGHKFELFHLRTFYPERNVRMDTYWYATEINKYSVSINIAYVDEKKGNQYLKILRDSKFDK